MGKLLHILLVGLLFPLAAFSQQAGSTRTISEDSDYLVEEFILPGGKNGNKVYSIVEGPYGFLWFGSQNGLHRYDGHQFITYGPVEGDTLESTSSLTYPSVGNLCWDSQGMLWVLTHGKGMFRFNPNTEDFKHYKFDTKGYDKEQVKYLNHVVCMSEDTNGGLWFGTGSGLVRFDRKTEQTKYYLLNDSASGNLSHSHISNIYLDKQGTLWVATGFYFFSPELGGLNRYDPARDAFTSYQHDPKDSTSLWSNPVNELLEDSRGDFWVATAAGLQKMDRTNGLFERMYPNSNGPYAPTGPGTEAPVAFSLLEDREGGLWVGTIRGDNQTSRLLRYDPETSKVDELPIYTRAWQLCESEDGTIWVAGSIQQDGKVLKITPKEKKYDLQKGTFVFDEFKKTNLYEQLGSGHSDDQWWGPLSLKFSPTGEMWLRYVYEPFVNGAFVSYAILAKYKEQSEEITFYHLEELDLSNLTSVVQGGNLDPSWFPEGFAFDNAGNVWGSYPTLDVGLFRFNPETGETTQYLHDSQDSNSLASNYVTILMGDRRGEIWAGYFENGLSRFNPTTEQWTHYGPIDGNSISALMEGSDGRIWVGGQNVEGQASIEIIDPIKNTTETYLSAYLSLQFRIRYFAQKEDMLVFAGDGFGLSAINLAQPQDPPKGYNTEANNFPIDKAGSLIFDQFGKLWISSHNDPYIVRFDVEREVWSSFKYNNDLLLQSRKGDISPQGNIYFPIINDGWIKIDPTVFQTLTEDSSQLVITDLFIQGERQIPGKSKWLSKPIWEIDQLSIPQKSMPFGVRVSSFDFRSTKEKYYYRLYPFDTEWNSFTEKTEITYYYLPVGTYELQIKAYNMNGSVGEMINLPVTIHPPWWQTWWAYSLYALAGLLLLMGFFIYQRRRWQLQIRLEVEEEKAERLKELDQFKSRFYTNITHEFRTPLTVIKGIATQMNGDERMKTLIQRNSTLLLNLVNQLLNLSKLETKTLTIDWIQGDIISYLQYLTESCHSLADSRSINLAFFSKEDRLMMDFDENKLQQILINLLSNAIKFTPQYGSVKVIAAHVMEKSKPLLELTIQDTGKGIPKEKLTNIFNRFYQVDDSTTRQGEGSGIGLALVKELVHLLSGRIEVKSEVGKGSVFMVYLPIHLEAQKALSTDLSTRPALLIEETGLLDQVVLTSTSTNDKNPLVLIIEDNADVTEYIVSCLSPNYTLQTARNGREGLEKALEIIPDIILSDVMMPEMDGFEVCQRLKADRRSSHIPIILLTAKASQEDKIVGLTQGADAYLTKPFDKEELLVRLRNLAAQSKRLQERLANPSKQNDEANALESQEAAFLQELNEIIASKLSNELFDTHHLCRAMAMSRSQLHRKLKALTGESTAKYIRSFRLQKAKSLLETTDAPIGEIALQVGFKDFSHFSRSFFKAFGIKPSDTR